MKNLPEFKALIERYESITIKEIESNWIMWQSGHLVAQELTGYGSSIYCTLCRAARCSDCTWFNVAKEGCCDGVNEKTYMAISNAKSPAILLESFRARAAYMRQVLKDGGIE